MTLEALVELDSAGWDKITDAQLLEIFKDALTVTRPEMAATRPKSNNTQTQPVLQKLMQNPDKAAAIKRLQMEGLDLSFMNKRKKR